MRTHPHAEAAYEVVAAGGDAFVVRIVIPGSYPTTVSGFSSQAAAERWVADHKERVRAQSQTGSRFGRSKASAGAG